MVLELKIPQGPTIAALEPVAPTFLAYVLSFVLIGIYWNNHHHLLHLAGRVNGAVLWANLHLLFWLSLMPLTTAWVGSNYAAALPTAVYGCDLFMGGIAYMLLAKAIVAAEGPTSRVAEALGSDLKGWLSLGMYAAAIPLAFVHEGLADALFIMVALMWLVPDRRIERLVE